MTARITPKQIKWTNRQQIYNYIYRQGKVSQLDITYSLHLSRPTVATNLSELEDAGLIFKNGQLDTNQIGRKAIAYSIDPLYKVAIGVEVVRHLIKIVAVDLYGKKLNRIVVDIEYENKDTYFKKVSGEVQKFIDDQGFSHDQVLGIGIAMQGLMSADGTKVVYGAILDCTGLTVDAFTRWLDYPCSFIHDPDAAALSELWCSPELNDAVYLSLSNHLGSSIIADRQVAVGRNGRSATFEHIRVRQKGELCYCGQRGCAETVCSMQSLVGDAEPEDFFEDIKNGDKQKAKRWKKYLEALAQLIRDLRMVYDEDFILGGHLAPFFAEEDIRFLYKEIQNTTPFKDPENYLVISKMPSHNITIGAALVYIRAFFEDIEEGFLETAEV